MKRNASFPKVSLKSSSFLSFFLLTSLLFLSLAVVWETAESATQARLSLADILVALRSKKVTLDERNRLLTDAVRARGITFALTPEIETELKAAGASDELVLAVREKGESNKPTPTFTPTPVSTPIPPPPTPTPTPNPVAAAAVQTPTPQPSPTPPDFMFYRRRADESIAKGDFDAAVNDYNKALELNSTETSLYLNRGLAFFNKKNYDSAIADFDKAIELNPKEAMFYFNRANSFERTGNFQKAVADYGKTIEIDPANEPAKLALQRVQSELARTSPKPNAQNTSVSNVAAKPPSSAATSADAGAAASVKVGQLTNEKAVTMAMPAYPQNAKKFGVQGMVTVEVTLDEQGNVVAAKALEGHQLLRGASEDAARKSKFKPVIAAGRPSRATGFIVYNFKAS